MVKNANTNTADQMVFKPVDARNPFPTLFVFYLPPNKELFSLSLKLYFFGPSYPTFVGVAYKPKKIEMIYFVAALTWKNSSTKMVLASCSSTKSAENRVEIWFGPSPHQEQLNLIRENGSQQLTIGCNGHAFGRTIEADRRK